MHFRQEHGEEEMTETCSYERADETISVQTDAYYEAQAGQEEIYLQEREESTPGSLRKPRFTCTTRGQYYFRLAGNPEVNDVKGRSPIPIQLWLRNRSSVRPFLQPLLLA
jgi:hypothetical protein